MKTVRVRILVAITDDGTYVADGNSEVKPRDLIASMGESIHHYMTPPVDYCWIEADVPVPAKLAPATISATVARRKP